MTNLIMHLDVYTHITKVNKEKETLKTWKITFIL